MASAGVLLAAALWLAGGVGDVPAFDCTRAVAADDLLICQDAVLTGLDAELGGVYVALRRQLSRAASEDLKRDQRAWVHRRNAGCGLAPTAELDGANRGPLTACFRSAYAERLAYLELLFDVLRAQPAAPETAPVETPL